MEGYGTSAVIYLKVRGTHAHMHTQTHKLTHTHTSPTDHHWQQAVLLWSRRCPQTRWRDFQFSTNPPWDTTRPPRRQTTGACPARSQRRWANNRDKPGLNKCGTNHRNRHGYALVWLVYPSPRYTKERRLKCIRLTIEPEVLRQPLGAPHFPPHTKHNQQKVFILGFY